MKKNSLITRITQVYFGSNLDLHIQTCNLLLFIGTISGIVMGTFTAIRGPNHIALLVDLLLSALSVVLLRVVAKTNYYRLCSWIVVVLAFLIAFPILFLLHGGYRGGMTLFFPVAIVYTAFMLDRPDRPLALLLEFLVYAAIIIFSYFMPNLVYSLPYEFEYAIDVAVYFVYSSVLLASIALLRNRMINIKQKQILELNRELTARNETLAQYDIMKSDFLATVAHEINTPLAVISASSTDSLDLLRETPLNMDEIVENQNLIERRVKLIDNILLDLMDTVAMENGRVSLDREPTDLSLLVRSICDAQFSKMDINDNTIIYDLQPDMPTVWADRHRIEQVMINLLSNAIRHTIGGVITIRTTRDDGNQTVSVSDTGEGMDAETLQAAFRSYVSTKPDYWRHGIGLYICRRIITAHGGTIGVDTEKGRGTTISFTLTEEAIDE